MSNSTGPFDGPKDTPGRLDVAIDRAVRRMMAAEPPPGFRHRVLARLRNTGPATWGFLPRFAFAGVAVAIIIVGVAVMLRPASQVEPPMQSAMAATEPPAPPAASHPAAQPQGQAVVAPPAAAPQRRERLPEPPPMAEIFGPRDSRVAATSVADGPLDDPRTPHTEPGTTFRSPIAGLPPLRLEDLGIPLVQVKPPRINPQ